MNFVGVAYEHIPDLDEAPGTFGLKVPRAFAERMRRADPDDPLLRQVLPRRAEHQSIAGYSEDPVADRSAERVPGLLVKYAGRALVVTTGACAIHCRYCFRRHFQYPSLGTHLEAILAAIAADQSLNEVILSGGDPLMLSDDRLAELIGRLSQIRQLKRLRIHSRVPVVWPERLNNRLAQILSGGRLTGILVIHANHPHELSETVCATLRDWRTLGLTLLNQSVLLKGVNDQIATLAELSERLFACGVLPYYLHALDRVAGSAHFAVEDTQAQSLIAGLRARLPGYLVPRLVREHPRAPAKQPFI
ncbi:EF-P beta-lysylation protein EpmB [Caldichromatium japonicum]|uniref:EF-P beta-lysylation protein EpmB n=1 Tax=Caldichromatium japonicum TaxID=2699430 RepID=UPI001FE2ED67|nr:EF-P beta-lysylation protein EpmB [Caldichromatium japonicum]